MELARQAAQHTALCDSDDERATQYSGARWAPRWQGCLAPACTTCTSYGPLRGERAAAGARVSGSAALCGQRAGPCDFHLMPRELWRWHIPGDE